MYHDFTLPKIDPFTIELVGELLFPLSVGGLVGNYPPER